MVAGDLPGGVESVFGVREAQVEQADVGTVGSDRGNASGSRGGDREDLVDRKTSCRERV